jgi:23S rRNA (adenine2503-C2)-methyltransferase
MMASDLKGMFPEEISTALAPLGVPAYRGRQVFAWLHKRLASGPEAMTDLSAETRALLTQHFNITTLTEKVVRPSPDGTTKYVFTLPDGKVIEAVYLPERGRATVCVSSMVGCPFQCAFCATGRAGYTRNLTAAEIVAQVYHIQAAHPELRISNVVFMGMGEPLANYVAVVRALRLLMHPQGLGLSQRHLTISTVGVIPGIERLAEEEGLHVNLAVSLHAPTQEARVRLVPVAKKYALDPLMTAVRQYVRRTGRKVTFEYTVVPGVNDREADAEALVHLVRRLQCLVNIIPLNPSEPVPRGVRTDAVDAVARAVRFAGDLKRMGIEVAVRRSRGADVVGACGQLAGEAVATPAAPIQRERPAFTRPTQPRRRGGEHAQQDTNAHRHGRDEQPSRTRGESSPSQGSRPPRQGNYSGKSRGKRVR